MILAPLNSIFRNCLTSWDPPAQSPNGRNVRPLILATVWMVLFTLADLTATADNWPQFRGINGSGVSHEDCILPADIAPDRHLIWKVPVGKGHSSPVIYGDRVFLTSLEKSRLVTLGIDSHTGQRVWQAEATYDMLEDIHAVGSHATPSVATDGHVVISFFGSSGLHAYDLDGELLWKQGMGPFDNAFGSAGSPVIVDDLVVIIQDHDNDAFLAAYHKRTGDLVWRVDRQEFRRNYSTPVIWRQGREKQVVIAGTAQVNAYDARTGEHLWVILRGSRVISATPVVADDGRLYVVNSGGGEADAQPSFEELLVVADTNRNHRMEETELPKSVIRSFFDQFDRNDDGSLNELEYETIRQTMTYARPVAMAVKSAGRGNIFETHVAWTASRSIPRNASPLVVDGKVFMIKDGGILTVLNAADGRILKTGRLRGTGKFFSSPIYGDGKIYAFSDTGKLNVITAEANWKQLASTDFEEDVYATPAIAGGRIYVRTVSHLYCIGLTP